MFLNIDASEIVKFTAKLEKISRSALPVAVRTALNSTAFDVKTKTMPEGAKGAFVERSKNFFKANSKVDAAKGFDIKTMEAVVGFVPKNGNDKSVDDLKQQEEGGDIAGRSFIPLPKARTGGSWNKNVRTQVRISDIRKKIYDSENATGANDKEKFEKTAIFAGKGGYVIGTGKNGNGNKTLYQIRSIVRKGKNTIINSVALYSVRGGRKVHPKPTGFMQKASTLSSKKMEGFFIVAAQKQIDKIK